MKSVNDKNDEMSTNNDTVDDKLFSSPFKQLVQTFTPPDDVDIADSRSSTEVLPARRSSLRKTNIAGALDPVGVRQSRKSLDVQRELLHVSDTDESKPLSTLSQTLQNMPGEVTLPSDSAAKPSRKRTGIQNSRKSLYSGRLEEKWPRSRVKSLEPVLCQKSSAACSPRRRKSEVSCVDAKVESDSTQNLPALEDSGRRVARPRKCNIQSTPVDMEAESNQQEDNNSDLLQHGGELTSKSEMGDRDGSNTAAMSSDDVRIVHLCNRIIM